MKTKQTISEEQCENTFRIRLPDQQGGIFSHDDKPVTIRHNKPRLADIISPVAGDSIASKRVHD